MSVEEAKAFLEKPETFDNLWRTEITPELWFPVLQAVKIANDPKYDFLFKDVSGYEYEIYKTLLFHWVDLMEENRRLKEENLELRYRPGGPGALEAQESFIIHALELVRE
jgi:hypothetical protein